MRRARLLSLTLSALFLFSTLTGCGIVSSLISGESDPEPEKATEAYTNSESESETEAETTEPPFAPTKDDLALYSIVIPEGCDNATSEIANKLQRAIKSSINIELPIKIDLVIKGSDTYCESEYEILVGAVNRAEIADGYSYLPIIIGGDCNTTNLSDLSSLLSGTRFSNSSAVAEEKKESGTWVGSSFSAITGGVLDHFFISEDTISVKKYEAIDNKIEGKYPSDHIPVRIDAIIYH